MESTRIGQTLQTLLRTIQDWVVKTDEEQDIREICEGRRKSKITSKPKNKIYRNAREQPNDSSTRKLEAKLELGKSTIHEICLKKA